MPARGGRKTGLLVPVKRSIDSPLRYGVAALVVGAAVLVKLLLDPLTAPGTAAWDRGWWPRP